MGELVTNLLGRIVTTIIAPTPLVAANFIILGRIIQRLGSKYSRLSAMWCTWFCTRPTHFYECVDFDGP